MEHMFKKNDRVTWRTVHGEACGAVVCHDTLEFGYMIVKLKNSRRMLVHESCAKLMEETTGSYIRC